MRASITLGLVAVVVAVVVAAAGCSGDEASVPASRLPALVLQPDDVPAGFERFDEGEITSTDVPPGPRKDPARSGRRGGWKVRYRAPSGTTDGILLVESRVDVFADSDGAGRDLDDYRAQFVSSGAEVQEVTLDDVVADAVAVTSLQPSTPNELRFTTVAWRQHNVTGSVLVEGYDAAASLDVVLRFVHAQAGRIEQEVQ